MNDPHLRRERAKREAEAAIARAASELAHGHISERVWHNLVTDAISKAYLIDEDPRWQSGFDGDAALWREARELVLECVSRDGTFLDVGCATGHLIECLAVWALQRNRRLAMYGLELSETLAVEARRRLPAWAEHIFHGNVTDWEPPMRFTYVRTGLEYVPAQRQPALVARLMRAFLEPGGRLIVGPFSEHELGDALAAFHSAGFSEPSSRSATDRVGKTRFVLCAGLAA